MKALSRGRQLLAGKKFKKLCRHEDDSDPLNVYFTLKVQTMC